MPLIVVPTPIGNLEDITLRAVRALREADAIACEDTRRTLKLLNHYGIQKTLISYHRHNEKTRTGALIARIAAGESIVLVSDAGTPGISDPGYVLIKEAIERNLPVDVLPGPNALLPALLLSGIAPQPFTFAGFIEGRECEKKRRLAALAEIESTLIFYIAPHGLTKELALFGKILGDRDAALVREISKVHQETIRDRLAGLALLSQERGFRGEIVLIVAGCGAAVDAEANPDEWQAEALRLRTEGIYDKKIANILSARYGIGRNLVKTFLLQEEQYDGE